MPLTNSTVPNLGFGRSGSNRAVSPLSTLTIVPGDFAMYNTSGHYWDIYANITSAAYFGGIYVGQQPPQSNPYPSGAGIPSAPAAPIVIQDNGIWEPGIILTSGQTVEDGAPLKITNAGAVELNGGSDADTIGYANVPQGGQITGDGILKIQFRIRCNFPSPYLAS
jgi:hypothetical protein